MKRFLFIESCLLGEEAVSCLLGKDRHTTPQWKSLLDEFELDWRLVCLAPRTATEYVRHQSGLLAPFPEAIVMSAQH